MQSSIVQNLKHLADGIIHLDKLPEALKMVAVGSRAFVRAVRAYQAAYDLLVDGVCGPVTMAKILEEDAKLAEPKKKSKPKKSEASPELNDSEQVSKKDEEE
jgi:hypothetical protein